MTPNPSRLGRGGFAGGGGAACGVRGRLRSRPAAAVAAVRFVTATGGRAAGGVGRRYRSRPAASRFVTDTGRRAAGGVGRRYRSWPAAKAAFAQFVTAGDGTGGGAGRGVGGRYRLVGRRRRLYQRGGEGTVEVGFLFDRRQLVELLHVPEASDVPREAKADRQEHQDRVEGSDRPRQRPASSPSRVLHQSQLRHRAVVV
mmetsp:Transcript_22402/g.53279  ORF Transcript_22402/g.53279 Transcript_22402/m.53279 type:complete len:200 (+) Transcript_22402:529-1128(+)